METEFDVFKRGVETWVARLGLLEWDVLVEEEPLDGAETRSTTYMNWTQKTARVVWNSTYRRSPKAAANQGPKEVACHEVLHIALNSLLNVAVSRGSYFADEVDAEEHALIRRLMNVMGPK